MDWQIDNSAPIYSQLVSQVKLGIVSGQMAPGSRLASVRDMALDAGVNPNTMQRALSELERTGLVNTQRTAGRFVTEDGELIAAARDELARALVRDFLDKMAKLGYLREDISALLNNHIKGENTDAHI